VRRKREERKYIATAAKQSSSYSVNVNLGFSSWKVEKAGELKASIDGVMRAVNDGKTTILGLVLNH